MRYYFMYRPNTERHTERIARVLGLLSVAFEYKTPVIVLYVTV